MARKKISDNTKVSISRWWFSGAIYFFLAFGTGLGNSLSAFDLVFILGVGTGLGTILIFNPIVFGMFDISRNGKIINKKYCERSVWTGVLQNLRELGTCFLVVLLIYATYQGINLLLIAMRDLPKNTVILKGEPFLFATLFLLYYNAFTALISNIPVLPGRKNKDK